MKISMLKVKRFRCIKKCKFFFADHAVLIGDNNSGKSTILEAIDLVLGPDRLSRKPVIDEHDFYLGEYLIDEENREIKIEVTITDLNNEQRSRFMNYIEWWDNSINDFYSEHPVENIDNNSIEEALRITFLGNYDLEEDDFSGKTFFSRSLEENDSPVHFTKMDKRYCGFLYLRSIRTARRALSLEHGSLLDIILQLKELRPKMWEKTIEEARGWDVASDPELGISGVLETIEMAMRKYVPREWGIVPRLKISNLTREHLRQIVIAFINTGESEHSAPFYRQGRGTLNILVLAMLSQIAADRKNVVFAMEEPETAIPPYAQKRIVHEVRKIANQSLFTSHSPYILEEFDMDEMAVLRREHDGYVKQATVGLPDGIKHKQWRREFRIRFCEGLLARRILVAEGATEAIAMPAVTRRLSELNPNSYSSFEALGICTIDAGGDSKIADIAKMYRKLGKKVFALCDKQGIERGKAIEEQVEKCFMHEECGFEDLVRNGTTTNAMREFIADINWPDHLKNKYPIPDENPSDAFYEYLKWSKGIGGVADFLYQCSEDEIPEWIKNVCRELKSLCQSDSGSAEGGDQ